VHEKAFRELIDRVCDSLMLHFPHPDGQWVIETDASYSGVGAVLSQRVILPDGRVEERIIAMESRGLRPSEKNYGVTEIEGLGVVFAFERFRAYVLGQYVEVITDHSALRFIFNGSCTNARLMRWAVQLQEFDFSVSYRKGALNRADSLSRYPKDPAPPDYDHVMMSQARWESRFADMVPAPVSVAGVHSSPLDMRLQAKSAAAAFVNCLTCICSGKSPQLGSSTRFETRSDPVVATVDSAAVMSSLSQVRTEELTLDNIRAAQLLDEFCQQLTRTVMNGATADDVAALRGTDVNRFLMFNDVLYFVNGPVRKRVAVNPLLQSSMVVVLPKMCRLAAMRLAHDDGMAGHFGVMKTVERLRDKFYWPELAIDAMNYCKSCDVCAVHKRDYALKGSYPFGTLPLPKRLFGRMQMDLIGPIKESNSGMNYILVCVCARTRWAEAIPLRTKTAAEVAEVFVDQLICRYGAPEELMSDHGSEFCNQTVSAINELFKIRHLHSAPYNPRCNGSVERLNGTLIGIMRRIISKRVSKKDWDKFIQPAMFAYRLAMHSAIKMTPFQGALGYNPQLPSDLALQLPVEVLDEFARSVDDRFKLTNELLEEAYRDLESKKAKDNATRVQPTREWLVGSSCYCKIESRPEDPVPKFAARWCGPWEVIGVNPNGLSLRIRNKSWPRREKTVHVDKVKPCVRRSALFVDAQEDLISTEDLLPGEHALVRPDLSQKVDPQLWICKIVKPDDTDSEYVHVQWYEADKQKKLAHKKRALACPLGPFHLRENWTDRLSVKTFMMVFDHLTPFGTLPIDLIELAKKSYADQNMTFPDEVVPV
jgi:hypothetical protein